MSLKVDSTGRVFDDKPYNVNGVEYPVSQAAYAYGRTLLGPDGVLYVWPGNPVGNSHDGGQNGSFLCALAAGAASASGAYVPVLVSALSAAAAAGADKPDLSVPGSWYAWYTITLEQYLAVGGKIDNGQTKILFSDPDLAQQFVDEYQPGISHTIFGRLGNTAVGGAEGLAGAAFGNSGLEAKGAHQGAVNALALTHGGSVVSEAAVKSISASGTDFFNTTQFLTHTAAGLVPGASQVSSGFNSLVGTGGPSTIGPSPQPQPAPSSSPPPPAKKVAVFSKQGLIEGGLAALAIGFLLYVLIDE